MAKTLNKPESKPTHDQIARRAYEIFEKNGRVPGRDMQNWLEAEKQLMAAIEFKREVAVVLQTPAKLTHRQQATARV